MHVCHRTLAFALLALAGTATGADHKDAPLINEDATADINDVYAFANPTDPSRVVFVITVNGFSVSDNPTGFNFSPNVRYNVNIDLDNDGQRDAWVRARFDAPTSTGQTFEVSVSGMDPFTAQVTRPTVGMSPNEPVVTHGPGGVTAFAGPRDDPFFFDLVGFNRFLGGSGAFSGDDAFAGFNVSAIVIELPAALVAGDATTLQAWASTERRRVTLRRASSGELETHVGPWEQLDRMGNPAVNTALIPSSLKDFYNIGTPDNDAADFAGDIVASLNAFGTSPDNIGILASVALPDTLKLDLASPVGYPNGRDLDDDVIDTLLGLILNGPVPDGVDANDRAFLNGFPYLAPPHQPM